MSAAEQQPQPAFASLYRRHRPRTFDQVVGQEPVVRTLRNAVQRDKVHHAYLFVGSRGTGKTSMAKILAACLNCERGPTTEPCGVCESCRSIASATSLDVIEMDAASNNSVEDIRELRESVAYAPVSGRRKVYILDEAHMLSTAAWNAFLKTLEEPPPGTVFVLATTEAGKVPATVVDRCHRFDFQRPTVEQIGAVLRRAAESESIAIPPEALAAIARRATGSFRDALGTLEQLLTYSGEEISLQDVLAVLGVADGRLLAETVDAVAAGDARAALGTLERCAAQGRDAASFAADLEVRLRELLIVQTLGEVPAELSLTSETDAALTEQAAAVPHAIVVRLLELLGEALEAIRAGADARTRLELALVKAARPETDSSLRALLARIERLEQERPAVSAVAAQREVPAPADPGPPGASAGAPGQSAAAEHGSAATQEGAPAEAGGAVHGEASAPVQAAPAQGVEGSSGPAGQGLAAAGDGSPSGGVSGPSGLGLAAAGGASAGSGSATGGASAPGGATGLANGVPAAMDRASMPQDAVADVQEAPVAAGGPVPDGASTSARAAVREQDVPASSRLAGADGAHVQSAGVAAVADAEPGLGSMASLWPAVVDLVRSENALLGALIAEAAPVALDGEELTLAFSSSFLKKKAEDPANRTIVAEALRSVTGSRLRAAYELREVAGAEVEEEQSEERWLARFVEEFDAVEVELPEQGVPTVTGNEKGA